MTSQEAAPLSYGADQLLEALAARLGPGPGANEWIAALLAEQPGAAGEAGAGLELRRLESAARARLAQGDAGAPLPRDALAAAAGRRAVEQGRDVATTGDVAFAVLEAGRGLVSAPEPEVLVEPEPDVVTEPGTETPAVPLSFGAEQLVDSLLGGSQGLGLHELLVALLERHGGAAETAEIELDLAALETAARAQLDFVHDRGLVLARDEIAALAGRRAAEQGREVATTGDVAYAILDSGRALVPPPLDVLAPVPPPTEPAEPQPEPTAPLPAPPAAPGHPRTFRLFVSSTFRDLEQERNALRERVYPALRDFCASRGARFQEIDLRWGVSEEASLDQQAMNICLGEIERCREVTPRPNFLVLLGNRYGWLALPPQIPEAEFERILGRIHVEEDRTFLASWYQRDENAIPAEYRLRPRTGEWAPPAHAPKEQFANVEEWARDEARLWEADERRLRAILASAVEGMSLEADRRRVYEASATEQEIAAGALELGAPEGRAFCFIREIELGEGDPEPGDADEDAPIRTFVDPDQTQLEALKSGLAGLPGARYRAGWDRERDAPTTDHLEALAADVLTALRDAIEEEMSRPSEPPGAVPREPRIEPDERLDAEGLAHREFADERIRFFVGRDDLLGRIRDYLTAAEPFPLVVEGEGGTGKSALLAEALRRAQDSTKAQLVYRFVGATPGSSDGRALLQGICRELARRYGADESEVPTDYQELSADFRRRLELATAERPLVLFVDSLDQLAASHGARRLAWLPERLPEHVRLVVSTRPGETLEPLLQRLERAGQGEAHAVELGAMTREEGGELLTLWLADAHRTLRQDQRDAALDAFAASSGNPLYLRLAFEEARRWIGEQQPETLAEGVTGIIEHNTFARLAHEENHGEVLVSRALGYLAASRHGLAEDELVDLLSRDRDVYRWFVLGSYHVPLDLRERLREYLPSGAEQGEVAEWVRQVRDGEREIGELDRFLDEVLPRGGLRLPVVLWSRLYSDLRPFLTEQAFEDAILIGFYHRELGDVARARYLGGGADASYHENVSRYFRPAPDGEGRPNWAEASRHALSELPYHLAEGERLDELFETLTDFRFLEEKAARVGVVEHRGADGETARTYTGVFQLQDDFERALARFGGGEAAARRPLIVTAVDFGEGLVVRCPWCNASHPFQEPWRGQQISCPKCEGPLKVNEFVVERQRAG
jgi:hypothetical protein